MEVGNKSSIPSFFAHKSVFLTGVTGFVGRALLEKILRGCPEVGKIYVLVRSKRDKSGEERLHTILQAELFERVRESNPNGLKNVVGINGDVAFDELGISNEDAATLRENVSIIIHSAAIVNFSAPFHQSVKTNVGGTKNVIGLAKTLKHLKAFVYVSTMFSNPNRLEINEEVYPIDLDPHVIVKLCEDLPPDVMDSLAPLLLRGHMQNYVLSKHLAEVLVHESRHDIPACIVRPSAVLPAHREPFPGWIDNLVGFNAACAAMSKGVFRVLYTNKQGSMEIVPIDHTVNLTLAAASLLGSSTSINNRDLMVYNCTSSGYPFVLNDIKRSMMSAFKDTPFNETLWYPSVLFVSNRLVFEILDYLYHYVPVVAAEGVLSLMGRAGIMRTYLQLKKLRDVALDISTMDYCISTTNTEKLYENLTPEDQESFNFNIFDLNYDEFVRNAIYGLRRYGAGEKDEDLPGARKRLRRLRVLYIATWALLILAVAFFVIRLLRL